MSELDDANNAALDQLQEVLRSVARSILLLEPMRPQYAAQYDRLREMRDQLEDAFTTLQTERLRAGEFGFAGDVDRLRGIVSDLDLATQREARAKEIIGYVTAAVEVVAQVLARILA